MSYTAEELLVLATDFEQKAIDSLEKFAKEKLDPKKKDKKKGKKKPPFWLNKGKNTDSDSSDKDESDAKDKKKKPPFWMKNKDYGTK